MLGIARFSKKSCYSYQSVVMKHVQCDHVSKLEPKNKHFIIIFKHFQLHEQMLKPLFLMSMFDDEYAVPGAVREHV